MRCWWKAQTQCLLPILGSGSLNRIVAVIGGGVDGCCCLLLLNLQKPYEIWIVFSVRFNGLNWTELIMAVNRTEPRFSAHL
uniref:Uncharacterized protein n=1 Tax=Kalanchoe fedtschenkoi TaxID=63787 RepID=A0A7N0V9L9_KALFE